jgi:hypothetical protein
MRPARRQSAAAALGRHSLCRSPAERGEFRSPRAFAATLLGLDAYCRAHPDEGTAERIRLLLAERLMVSLASAETPDWVWFEDGLSYDNARLSQALIVTGLAAGSPPMCRPG